MQAIVDACGCHAKPTSRAICEMEGWCSAYPPAFLSPTVLIHSCMLILFLASQNLNYDSYLVVTCQLSRFTCAFPCSKKITGEQTGNILAEQRFKPYGAPKKVHSDEDIRVWGDNGWRWMVC